MEGFEHCHGCDSPAVRVAADVVHLQVGGERIRDREGEEGQESMWSRDDGVGGGLAEHQRGREGRRMFPSHYV